MQQSLEFLARAQCWPLIQDWGSHSSIAEDASLLECYTVLLDECIITFRRSVMPSFLWSSNTRTLSLQKVRANLHILSSSGTYKSLSLHLHISCSLTLQWCWDLNSNYYPGLRGFKFRVCFTGFTNVPGYGAVRPEACEELQVCTEHWAWCWRVNCTPIPAITQKKPTQCISLPPLTSLTLSFLHPDQ